MNALAHSPEYTLAQKSGDLLASKNTTIKDQADRIAELESQLREALGFLYTVEDPQMEEERRRVIDNIHAKLPPETEFVNVITWGENWKPIVNKVKKFKVT